MGYPNGINQQPTSPGACNFESHPATEDEISEYTCVFKQSYARQGLLNASVQGDDRPQHWSNLTTDFSKLCSTHLQRVTSYSVPGNNPYVEIQKTCVGHKLKTGDLRNQEFTSVKKKRVVTLDAIKQIVNVLKFLIAERAKSPKYKYCYNRYNNDYAKGSQLPLFSNSTEDDDNVSGEKISYKKCMYKILDCIRNLQRSDVSYSIFQCADSYPALIPPVDGGVHINETTEAADALSSVEEVTTDLNQYNGNILSPFLQACTHSNAAGYNGPTTRKAETPLVSKSNIDLVIQTIKYDLNDCICYGDCNGYSVCFCYGNCNHY